jgi:hypothetical protein
MYNVIVNDETPPECIETSVQFYLNESGTDSIQLSDIPLPAFDECSDVLFSNPEMILAADCRPIPGLFVSIEDSHGNSTDCLIAFQINDTLAPTCIVENQILEIGLDQDNIDFNPVFESIDNCSESTVSFSIPLDSNLSCGFSEDLTMFVVDEFGNQDSCQFILTVTECLEDSDTICELDIECDTTSTKTLDCQLNEELILSSYTIVDTCLINNWLSAPSSRNAHSIVLKEDQTLWGWGDNLSGQLGIEGVSSVILPIQIGTQKWKSVEAGGTFSIAIREDGTLWSTGHNNVGQLGMSNETIQSSSSFIQIGTDNDWATISTGFNRTFAIKTDGTLWRWGNSEIGPLF